MAQIKEEQEGDIVEGGDSSPTSDLTRSVESTTRSAGKHSLTNGGITQNETAGRELKERRHVSEENLDRTDEEDLKPVPLLPMSHATSMPHILTSDPITSAPSKQNISECDIFFSQSNYM